MQWGGTPRDRAGCDCATGGYDGMMCARSREVVGGLEQVAESLEDIGGVLKVPVFKR